MPSSVLKPQTMWQKCYSEANSHFGYMKSLYCLGSLSFTFKAPFYIFVKQIAIIVI